MPSTNDKRVDLGDAGGVLAKAVLEAAETLSGNPVEVQGLPGRQHFLAPSKQLENICRRWLAPHRGSSHPS